MFSSTEETTMHSSQAATHQKKHAGFEPQTIVVKLGGTEGVDFSAICQDIVEMIHIGHDIILVHGGSAEANALGEALGIPPRFVTSPSGYTSRYTNRETLEIFSMAVNGKINTLLVEQLQMMGVNAFGLSGLDGGAIQAKRKSTIRIIENGKRKVLRDDYTGKIERVNTDVLAFLMANRHLPVIAPIAVSENGEALNVDADRAAAMVAATLRADTLLLLTAVPGLLKDFPDENSLIKTLPRNQLDSALEYAQGRMKKKILGSKEALQGGVKQVIIADGRIDKPISSALAGNATYIR
jgi:acetylglutamate/LysW-gamma-L-alpha-aminoadipate kinase